MKSILMYKGSPRIVREMLIACGERYEVDVVDAMPCGFDVEVTGADGTRTIMYPSAAAFVADWEAPFSSLHIDAPL